MPDSELLSKQRRYNIGEYKNLNQLTANTVTLDYLKFGIDTSNITIRYPDDLTNDGYTLALPNRSGVSGEFLGIDDNNKLKWGNPNVINNVQIKYGTGLNTSVIDSTYTKGQIIFPDSYEITITPTSTTSKLLIQFRCTYIASFSADTAITFYIYKTISNVQTEVQVEANLGPLNATGTNRSQYVTSTVIESGTIEPIKISFGYAFNNINDDNSQAYKIGILGNFDYPGYNRSGYSGYQNSIIVTDFEGSGSSSTLFSKSHDNNSIYYNNGTVYIGNDFNSLNTTSNSNYSLVTKNMFSKNLEVSGNLLYNNEPINKLKIPINKCNQDFFQLLTEQPRSFKYEDHSITSSQVTLKWSLEDLYPSNNDSIYINLYENDKRILPVINNINFDLSYNNIYYASLFTLDRESIITPNSNRYINDHTLTKNFLENRSEIYDISSNFDIYVYGNNNSNQQILDSNKLIFRNLLFITSREPSKPILENINVLDNINQISGEIKFDNIEIEDDNTALKIDNINIIYTNNRDTLRSNTISVTLLENNYVMNNLINDMVSSKNFTITDLYYGTKYDIKGNGKNNGSDNYSLYSDTSITQYTIIPDMFNNIHYSRDNMDIQKKQIQNNNYELTNIIYINDSDFFLDIKGNLEITKQIANKDDSQGYGKFIDNEKNIFNIEIKKNLNTLYKYTVDNWISEQANTYSNNISINISTDDVYSTQVLKQGFRKKINYNIEKIDKKEFTISNNIQNLYIYFDSSYNSEYTSNNLDLEFVYDNLPISPQYNIINILISPIDYIYCCGIPSVLNFEINIEINLTNMNSENKWVPVNFGEIHIENEKFINGNTIVFNIDRNNINGNGIYNFTYNSGMLYFTQSCIDDTHLSISFPNSFIENLKERKNIENVNVNNNLYCDYKSFNLDTSNKISYLKDNVQIFYEVNDKFNINNFTGNNIHPYLYNNHNNNIKAHTLEFIDNKFRNNDNRRYIITSKETNSISELNNYHNNFKNLLDNISSIKYILIYYYNNVDGNVTIGAIHNLNNNVGFNSLSPWYNNPISITNNINIDNIKGVMRTTDNHIIINTNIAHKYYIIFIY